MNYQERHKNDDHATQHLPIESGITLDDVILTIRETLLESIDIDLGGREINPLSMSYDDVVWLMNELKDHDDFMQCLVGELDVLGNSDTCEKCAKLVHEWHEGQDYRHGWKSDGHE